MNNEELEKTVIQEIEKATVPVNTEFIARKAEISWSRASRLLLGLTVQGRISALQTMSGYLYHPAKPSITEESNEKLTVTP